MVAGQEKSGWVKRGGWVMRMVAGQEKSGWVKRGDWVKRREDGSREGRMARMRVMAESRIADGKVQRTPYQCLSMLHQLISCTKEQTSLINHENFSNL